MRWRPFRYGEDTFELCHLHPKTVTYVQAAKRDKPARSYTVDVIFSLHCFTRGINPGEVIDPSLCYGDDRETRVFDFQRYRLSFELPAIIDSLMRRKCFHTSRGNFFTIEVLDPQTGAPSEYEIYFTISRSSRSLLSLHVQSAYVRDRLHRANRPHRKTIGFHVILFNVLNKIEIRVPK